jgi:hypothetical protein
MVWLTPEEKAQARLADVYHVPQWEGDFQGQLQQLTLFQIYAAVGYAEKEKRPDWDLPGHGKARVDCGSWKAKGCDNVLGHKNGKVFGRYFRRNCRQRGCPTCFEGWAAAEGERGLIRMSSYVSGPVEVDGFLSRLKSAMQIEPKRVFHEALTVRLEILANSRGMRPIHVVLSPPDGTIDETIQGFRKGRQLAYDIARYSGLKGGLCVFHPYRLRCPKCGVAIDDYGKSCPKCGGSLFLWFWSPHFHFLGYGWIQNTVEGYERHGWVVKNLRVRKSVFWTLQYLLSHAGVSRVFHTVTWFGDLAYNVLGHVPALGAVREICPYCGRVLMPLQWIGGEDRGPPAFQPSREDLEDAYALEFLADPSDWRVV